MILLFNPGRYRLEWCLMGDGSRSIHQVDADDDWRAAVAREVPPDAHLDTFGYVLPNGGDLLTRPVERLTSEVLECVDRLEQSLPESNPLTLALAKHWMAERPEAEHLLFCDTAFFSGLPPEVRDYALPPDVAQRGIHRYGGHGLCHEHAWTQVQEASGGNVEKMVSIYLGDRSDLAAIRDGRALETTIGLTHLEGVLSSGGCGDIDPTIVFQLGAAGMPYSAINRMLSTQSGFAGIAGKPCDLAELLAAAADADLTLARRMLTYQITKYVGAFVAVLGGADTLAFVGEDPAGIMPLIREICAALGFLGVRCEWGLEPAHFPRLISSEDSALRVLVARYDLWETMSGRALALINENKELKR